MSVFVKVGLEAHDRRGKGADVIGYQGPDGDMAAAAYVALQSVAIAMQRAAIFADIRVYYVRLVVTPSLPPEVPQELVDRVNALTAEIQAHTTAMSEAVVANQPPPEAQKS